MKASYSINRPVLARRLELDKRRRDYKIHLKTLKEQKCGTDFSHPPVIFRLQTVQKNSNAKRKERKRYEDMLIDKINEQYANKVNNSKSFHDPCLIEQVNRARVRKVSPSASQIMSPKSKSPAFRSARSIKSKHNMINENEGDNNCNSFSARKINKYNIPHYNLPPEILKMDIYPDENGGENQNDVENKYFEGNINVEEDSIAKVNENVEHNENTEQNENIEQNENTEQNENIEQNENTEQNENAGQNENAEQNTNVEGNKGFAFQYNEILQNVADSKRETENDNCNEETFEIHPPEGAPQRIPSRSNNVSPDELKEQNQNEQPANECEENFEEF